MYGLRRAAAAAVIVTATLAACGDDNGNPSQQAEDVGAEARQRAQEAAQAVEQAGEAAGARTVAEAIRAALVVEELDGDRELRNVEVLREAVDDVPGDPEVTGIEDTDGDTLDDDGRLEVVVGDERACLTVPETGSDIDVRQEGC